MITGASQEAIEKHYDVGNAFYSTFLDPQMVYSCALFSEGDTLEKAQLRKLDYHLEHAGAKDAKRLLDIGCGWGALLRRAKRIYGVDHCVGLTLSPAQRHYIENHSDCSASEVLLESWDDHRPTAPYNAIVSIGAFEHFVKPGLSSPERVRRYRQFFQACADWLTPKGRLSLQTISYDNMARESMSAFIANEIFPESDLPKLEEICEAADGLFSVLQLRNDAPHYEETCRRWLTQLRTNESEVVRLTDEAKFKQYERYLAMVTMGFRVRTMGLIRVSFVKTEKPYR